MNFSSNFHGNGAALYTFTWIDYLVFVLTIATSVAIGIYFGCFGSKQKSIAEYLFGGKNMSPFSLSMSIAVGHFSATLLIGASADVYKYGAYFLFSCLGFVILGFTSVYIYLPVLYDLQCASIYEYFEKRFDKRLRLLVSGFYVLNQLFSISIYSFVPALVISTATGIHINLISFFICFICIFYTAIGGLKTVVWTDIFQFVVILLSMVMVVALGLNSSNGIVAIWTKAVDGRRLEIFDFDFDLTKRDKFWSMTVGLAVQWSTYICISQSGLQKFSACRSYRECVWTVIYYVIWMWIVSLYCVILGLLLYAKYSDCDPLLSHRIQRNEQIVGYYMMEVTENIPGVFGFFLVSLLCANLSSISSELNALSCVVYSDFFDLFRTKPATRNGKNSNILKLIVVATGAISIGLSFVVQHLGDIIPAVISIIAIVNGPTLGLFTLGVLFPKANALGAFYGAVSGFVFLLILILPLKFYHGTFSDEFAKPLSIKGCNESVFGYYNSTDFEITENKQVMLPAVFRISYYYHCTIGALVTVTVGLIISHFTSSHQGKVEKNLINPFCHKMMSENLDTEAPHEQKLMSEHKRSEDN